MTPYETIICCSQIAQYEQRIYRLQQQLKDTRQASIGATPEGKLLHK